jgi:hypothetical protein
MSIVDVPLATAVDAAPAAAEFIRANCDHDTR